MQTEDKSIATRIPMEGGTKINMYFGDTVIPGVLNDSETAKALIEKLPMTQHMSRYSHDFCGVTEELPHNEEDVHYGWLNGDIDYALNAPYFTILFEDEDVSEQYGDQVNIGVITCPLSDIAALDGSFDVRIELAEWDVPEPTNEEIQNEYNYYLAEQLTKKLLGAGNDQKKIDKIGDAIISLREERQAIFADAAARQGLRDKVNDLVAFLDEQTMEITEYSETLVRRLIEKIIVYDEKLTVEFKSGLEINVDA